MDRNLGKLDRSLRLLAAVALLLVAFRTEIAADGALHLIALAAAAVMAVTALLGNCPLYRLIGLKTCRDC